MLPDYDFGLFEFFLPASIAALLDQFSCCGKIGGGRIPRVRCFAEEEAGAVEVNISHVQPHGAALGDFPGFVQIGLCTLGAGLSVFEKSQPGAGEEAAGNVVHRAGAAEAGHGSIQFAAGGFKYTIPSFQNRRVECSAAQSEMVESDI